MPEVLTTMIRRHRVPHAAGKIPTPRRTVNALVPGASRTGRQSRPRRKDNDMCTTRPGGRSSREWLRTVPLLPYSVTHYWPPAPSPRRPRPPGVPIVGSSVLFLRPRDGGVQPSIDGPFWTNRTSGLSGLPVRYWAPPLPQNLPARSVAFRLTVSSDWYRGSVCAHPETATDRCYPGSPCRCKNVLAISFALMMPSSVSNITTTSMLSLKVFWQPPGTPAQTEAACPAPELRRLNGGKRECTDIERGRRWCRRIPAWRSVRGRTGEGYPVGDAAGVCSRSNRTVATESRW